MYKRLLLIILFIEVFLYIFLGPNIKTKLRHVGFNKFNNVNIDKIKLENYVIGVVAAEMPATFSFESLKAQAVVSRTFIYRKIVNGNISYDNLNDDKGQAYITKKEMKDKWKNNYDEYYLKIKRAVEDTKDEIVVYNNEPIKAYYFSSSNGMTEDSKAVFGEEEYLISVDTSFDKKSKEYEKEVIFSAKELLNKLNINSDVVNIGKIERSSTNHVISVEINSIIMSGIEFRKKLGLRSTDFDIFVNSNEVMVVTRGYGHGVGMSQYGANYLASNGKDYREIIKYFYHNVNIDKI